MTDETASSPAPLGPPVFENWKAFLKGQPRIASFEFPLFTDARVVGDDVILGPYVLFNALALDTDAHVARPGVVLRYHAHIDMNVYSDRPIDKTDVTLYHGGHVTDEIAALISLASAMRLKPGAMSRRFEGEDQAGRPVGWDTKKTPQLLTAEWGSVIPTARDAHFIANVDLLNRIPQLGLEDIIVLLRSARLFQDGLWITESESNLAWLMLVSAVETAAIRWRAAKESPRERLEASRPELAGRLRDSGGDELVDFVADELADSLGSTRKFVDFVIEHLTDPPPKRPIEWAQVDWSAKNLKTALRQIYGYRSAALHAGKPFPAPMCEPPFRQDGWDAAAEKPIGSGARAKGGAWRSEDLPMSLHVFAYIARWALLEWWRALPAA